MPVTCVRMAIQTRLVALAVVSFNPVKGGEKRFWTDFYTDQDRNRNVVAA